MKIERVINLVKTEVKDIKEKKDQNTSNNQHINQQQVCSKQEAEALKSYNQVTFQYHHPLKTLFKKGKLPWLKYGMYGDKLDPKNVTLEHIEPVHSFKDRFNGNKDKAQKAATTWDNVALASKRNNSSRGDKPLSESLDWEALGIYLNQFIGKYIPGFGKGEEYVKGVINKVNKLIQQGL